MGGENWEPLAPTMFLFYALATAYVEVRTDLVRVHCNTNTGLV